MHRIAGDICTCSSRIAPQLSALATLSRYWSRRLQSSLHPICGRQTAQTTISRVSCRNEFTRLQCVTQLTSSSSSLRLGKTFHRLSSTKSLTSGATTTQSKGTSLRALAVTNRILSEPPNATTLLPSLFRATHILSKKIAIPSYA